MFLTEKKSKEKRKSAGHLLPEQRPSVPPCWRPAASGREEKKKQARRENERRGGEKDSSGHTEEDVDPQYRR